MLWFLMLTIVCQDILRTDYINDSAGELGNNFSINFTNSETQLCLYNVMKTISLKMIFVNLRLLIIYLQAKKWVKFY